MKTCFTLLFLAFSLLGLSAQDCDPTPLFTATNDFATGLAVHQDTFWVADAESDDPIVGYSSTGEVLATLNVDTEGVSGGDLFHDGNRLWICVEQLGKVFVCDPNTGIVEDQFVVPTFSLGDPNHFGITMDDNFIWVAEYTLDPTNKVDVFRLDKSTFNPVDTFTVNGISSLAIELVFGSLYIPSWETEELYVVDPFTGNVEEVRDWCVPRCDGTSWSQGVLYAKSSSVLSDNRVYLVEDLSSTADLTADFEVDVFPNPCVDFVTVQVDDPQFTPESIQAFDGMGRRYALPHTGTGFGAIQVDVRDVPAGLFYLQVGMKVVPVVKE
jgi:hypothetical protein